MTDAAEETLVPPECERCRVLMIVGQVLVNIGIAGVPDFPGDGPGAPGQTISPGGAGKLVRCWKCPRCGASRAL